MRALEGLPPREESQVSCGWDCPLASPSGSSRAWGFCLREARRGRRRPGPREGMGGSGKETGLPPDESSQGRSHRSRERDRRDFYTRDPKGAEKEAVL